MKDQNEDSVSVWEIKFNRPLTESEEWQLLGLGAEGVEKRQASYFAIFAGNRAALFQFLSAIETEDLKAVSFEIIPQKNWVQCCAELWAPVRSGRITVAPVLDENSTPPVTSTELTLLLIPGTGFGTGHHESTRMVLGLMQHQTLLESAPKTVFDVGTGSGILALAAAALFNPKIDAVDTDPLAVENAATNIRLNRMQDRISLKQGGIEDNRNKYDLVLANIYAEVLIELAPFLESATARGGHLILSGITLDKREMLIPHFAGWEIVEERQDNNWVSLLLGLK